MESEHAHEKTYRLTQHKPHNNRQSHTRDTQKNKDTTPINIFTRGAHQRRSSKICRHNTEGNTH